MPFSIFYTINKENTELFIFGPKPPGPTGRGLKPLGAELQKGRNLWQPYILGFCIDQTVTENNNPSSSIAEIPKVTRPPDISGKMKSLSGKINQLSRHPTSCLVKILTEVFVDFTSKKLDRGCPNGTNTPRGDNFSRHILDSWGVCM